MHLVRAFFRLLSEERRVASGSGKFSTALARTASHTLVFLYRRIPTKVVPLQNRANKIALGLSSFIRRRSSQRISLQKRIFQFPTGAAAADFTVIIPVYGQLGYVANLLKSLELDLYVGVKVIVIDDHKDSFTSKKLRTMIENTDSSTTLIVNEKNLGYLRSVNLAIQKCETRFAVLLNSDVELPTQWLERFARAITQPETALATALATNSGANLSVAIPKGRTWREVDGFIGQLEPQYPEACTAIGYALAVDLSKVTWRPFFDRSYKDGYGEDSDLHYRVQNAGYKSVVIDNLLVQHASGLSYDGKSGIEKVREGNSAIFQGRWGGIHAKREMIWALKQPLTRVASHVRFMDRVTPFVSDVVVVLPTVQKVAGGISVALEICQEINRNGLICRVLPLDEAFNVNYVRISQGDVRIVMATGIGTYDVAEKIAQRQAAQLVSLFQGPELFFENGLHFETFANFVPKADLTIAMSPYLQNLANQFKAKSVVNVQMGPDANEFYDEKIRRKKQVVFSSRTNFEKGTIFSIPLMLALARDGWSVLTVGPIHPSLYNLEGVKNLGVIAAQQMRKIFSESAYLIDLSLFEGLGLVPMEAIACGCQVIMQKKGGTESVLGDAAGVHWISNPIDPMAEIESLMASNSLVKVDAEELLIRRNLKKASIEVVNAIQGILGTKSW